MDDFSQGLLERRNKFPNVRQGEFRPVVVAIPRAEPNRKLLRAASQELARVGGEAVKIDRNSTAVRSCIGGHGAWCIVVADRLILGAVDDHRGNFGATAASSHRDDPANRGLAQGYKAVDKEGAVAKAVDKNAIFVDAVEFTRVLDEFIKEEHIPAG